MHWKGNRLQGTQDDTDVAVGRSWSSIPSLLRWGRLRLVASFWVARFDRPIPSSFIADGIPLSVVSL